MLMLNEIGIVFRVIQFENTEKSGKKVDLFMSKLFLLLLLRLHRRQQMVGS